MASRRLLLRAGMAAPLAMIGAAAASPSPTLVGYTASGTLSPARLDKLTGRRAQVVREYHRLGKPVPTRLPDTLLAHLGEGRNLVYSLKIPDSSTATYAACESLAADIAANGYAGMVWIILWHEPYPDFPTNVFIDRYRAIAPAIRSQGIACGVCFHTYPIWRKGVDYAEYWPGDDLTDFMAIDTYPSDTHDGLDADPLATMAPLTAFARARGKPFGIAEFGVSASDAAADRSAARAWIRSFTRLGDACEFIVYWNGATDKEMGLEQNNGLLIPAYQDLYDSFN